MVDIETKDSGPQAAVVAIGARLFTLAGPGKGFETFIDEAAASEIGTTSVDTMNWWHKQPAFDQVFSGKTQPADAAYRLTQFVNEHKPDVVWANSPSFDCVILRHMFKQLQLKFPFHYRDERDFRTMVSLGRDLGVDTAGCWEGLTAHSPLDDATAQAKALVLCLNKVFSTPAIRSDQDSAPPLIGTLRLPASSASKPSATQT